MTSLASAGTLRTSVRGVPASVARSWLLHPATALDALRGQPTPDVLVLDLEDAVPESAKSGARLEVAEFLSRHRAWVRINDAASSHWQHDLDALSGLPGLAGVVLAKVESPADVRRTATSLGDGLRIVPMVESASSLEQVEGIARHAATFRIAFGVGDFRRDTGISGDPIALAPARSRLVVASVAAGIRAPIDGPTHGSADAVAAGVTHGRAMGMTGALVLDPARLAVVHEALSPSAAELAWARDTLAADGQRDGSYAPTLARANALIALSEQLGNTG